MAGTKLSQITAAISPPALTDELVGVGGGTSDLLYTLQQVADTIAPIATTGAPGLVQPDGTSIVISGGVISSTGGSGGSPGGSPGDIQYYGSGATFAGDPDFTTDGSGHVDVVTINGVTVYLDGSSNFSVGSNNFGSLTTGSANAAFGLACLEHVTSGDNNFAIGLSALQNVSDGRLNVAVGTQALGSVDHGQNNVGIGFGAGGGITSGVRSVAIGHEAIQNGGASNDNVAIGDSALNQVAADANIGIGSATLQNLSGGTRNTVIGVVGGESLVNGSYNTIIGGACDPGSDTTGVIIVGTGDGVSHVDYNLTVAGAWTFDEPIIPPSYAVSGLPTPVAGMRATVTDSTVAYTGTAVGNAPVGSGSHTVPVFANEVPAWVIG